jgi:hypothetical protein
MALNADGFHSTSVRRGPTIVDSEIAFTGDDHLNIQERMLVVCKQLDATQSIAMGASRATSSLAIIDPSNGALADTRPGDVIQFYKLLSGAHPAVNPLIGHGVVSSLTPITDAPLLAECHAAATAMQQPPFNATLIINVAHSPVFQVNFQQPLPSAVTASRYNLATLDTHSGAGALLERNHFHDSCGSGGRILLKSRNATFRNNVAERFGGVFISTEQEWLEGVSRTLPHTPYALVMRARAVRIRRCYR